MKALREIATELRLLREAMFEDRPKRLECEGMALIIQELQDRLRAKGPTYGDGYAEGYDVGYSAGFIDAAVPPDALSSPAASASQSHPSIAVPSSSPLPTE